jgi:hypothetical protein
LEVLNLGKTLRRRARISAIHGAVPLNLDSVQYGASLRGFFGYRHFFSSFNGFDGIFENTW